MKNSKSIKNVNLIVFISLVTLIAECSALKYSIDLPQNIFEKNHQADLWHPHLKRIINNNFKDNFEIIDTRKSFTAHISLVQKQINENKAHSFLQVTEPLRANKDPQSPKMKCGCKFIRDNEKFLNANLKALENKLAFSKEHGSFVEVKGKNELIASNKSQIKDNNKEASIKTSLNENNNPKAENKQIQANEFIYSNKPIQANKPSLSLNKKSSDVYQQQIDELRTEIIQNNSLLNKIESLLENKNTKNTTKENASSANNQNTVPIINNNNNASIVPINNEIAYINRNLIANQMQMPNNFLNANANMINNPYLIMNNNNAFQPNLNMNPMQINSNPLGVLMNNNNFAAAAAAYQNPFIANANNFGPALNNQFLGLNRF